MKTYLFLVLTVLAIIAPASTLAQTPNLQQQVGQQIQAGATAATFGTKPPDPRTIVANAIKFILSLLGMFFVALAVMAGYWMFTAAGEEEKFQKGTKTLRAAIIGLGIILAGYSIAYFVGKSAINVTTGPVREEPQGLQLYGAYSEDGILN